MKDVFRKIQAAIKWQTPDQGQETEGKVVWPYLKVF